MTELSISVGAPIGGYHVTACLGAGGMGEVYKAHDPRLGRIVAIKVLPTSHLDQPGRRRRFENELHALAALNHPNILAVYDAGFDDGRPFIVTEYLEGQTLRDRLASAPPIATRIDYAVQIARGLAAAHAGGVLHRDLKPDNVFVTTDGRVKILDFGLARSVNEEPSDPTQTSPSDLSEPGSAPGTVGYMSPEQVLGHKLDRRSDIFSFGALLYEMLSGRRLFQRATRVDAMHAIVHDELPTALELDPLVPPFVHTVLLRCVAKNPADRFQTADDLAFALSTPAPPVASIRPARPPIRVFTIVAICVIGAAITVGAFFAGASSYRRPSPSFQRLTFRRGNHGYARFAPDGKTIVYSAWWDGEDARLFSTRLESPESRALDADADVLSISNSGEMAVLLNPTNAAPSNRVGTLAIMPLGGGAPRPLIERVQGADWSPDGRALAIIRDVDGGRRLEFPIGQPLYASNFMFSPRVSPKGDRVAFIEAVGSTVSPLTSQRVPERYICVIDRMGTKAVLATGMANTLAWSPDGTEVWFADTSLHAVTLGGRLRTVLSFPEPGWGHLQDISPDGQVLLVLADFRAGIIAGARDSARERDVSWLGGSEAVALSSDAGRVLFSEVPFWSPSAVYVRGIDGSPAVRLGDGRALSLSPDGQWALARLQVPPFSAVLYPTGPGERRTLVTEGLEYLGGGAWLPDGEHLIIIGRQQDARGRAFVVPLTDGHPRAVTPEGVVAIGPPSPDGRYLTAFDAERHLMLYPIAGEAVRQVPGAPEPGDLVAWTADGAAIFVAENRGPRIRVFKRDLATGSRDLWKDTVPADPAGIYSMRLLVAPDGQSYIYSYQRFLSNLFAIRGLN